MENEILATNKAFYMAFRDRDMAAMQSLWASLSYEAKQPLCCIHPGQEPIFDRQEIIQSWEQITSSSDSPNIDSTNEQVLVYSPTLALVVCEEDIAGNTATERLTATNLFVLQNGEWKISHHHAGRRN